MNDESEARTNASPSGDTDAGEMDDRPSREAVRGKVFWKRAASAAAVVLAGAAAILLRSRGGGPGRGPRRPGPPRTPPGP